VIRGDSRVIVAVATGLSSPFGIGLLHSKQVEYTPKSLAYEDDPARTYSGRATRSEPNGEA
jgi:hypothetical protein